MIKIKDPFGNGAKYRTILGMDKSGSERQNERTKIVFLQVNQMSSLFVCLFPTRYNSHDSKGFYIQKLFFCGTFHNMFQIQKLWI